MTGGVAHHGMAEKRRGLMSADNTQSEIVPHDPVKIMLQTGQITITSKGEANWPGNYKALNDRQVMNLVKMVQDGKARRPETVKAILTEALDRGLITA
jgi:hypothetical protein